MLFRSKRPTASISVWIPNYNASAVYKATPTSSVYATYNFSRNTSGAVGNGGGITGWNAAGTALFKDNFLQPSELIKLTWILAMAAWLRTTAGVKRMAGVVAAIAVTAIPFVLIALQPDLDSALLFWPALLVMLLAAGARIKQDRKSTRLNSSH